MNFGIGRTSYTKRTSDRAGWYVTFSSSGAYSPDEIDKAASDANNGMMNDWHGPYDSRKEAVVDALGVFLAGLEDTDNAAPKELIHELRDVLKTKTWDSFGSPFDGK